jgi:hypothetical protein
MSIVRDMITDDQPVAVIDHIDKQAKNVDQNGITDLNCLL